MLRRRDFIVAGVSAAGTAAIMHTLYTTSPALDIAQDFEQDGLESQQLLIESGLGAGMDELLHSLENSDALGRAWLDEQTPRPTLKQLGETLASSIDLTATTLSDVTAEQIKNDFSQNNLFKINGWHLSITECQLAALRVLAIDANPANASILAAREKARLNAELTIAEIAPLDNWGPQETLQGEKFNEQPDGHSGLWFQFQGAPAHVQIMIDGEYSRTNVKADVVTSGLFGELQERILAAPGAYEIALVDPISKTKQPIGEFVVKENPSYQANGNQAQENGFCPVTKWGPQETQAGVATNEQPDGSMGVWVHTECLPEGTELRFGDDALRLTRSDFGFTTSIPLPLLETPGEKALHLVNINSPAKEGIVIGHITIK